MTAKPASARTIPVSFNSLTSSSKPRPSCNLCKVVGGLLGRGAALLISPFSMCARGVSRCLSQVLCKRKVACDQINREAVKPYLQILDALQRGDHKTADEIIDHLFQTGDFRMDDDLRNKFRNNGLFPPIARRYFEELSRSGAESSFVRGIRVANAELEQDLWWNSDFSRDERGIPVFTNTTAKDYFIRGVEDQNENVLEAYQRVQMRLDGLQVLDDSLAAGRLISSSWLLKSGISLSTYTPMLTDPSTAKTPEERLKTAIDRENIGYISAHKVLKVSYPVNVDMVVYSDDSEDAVPTIIMGEDVIIHSKESAKKDKLTEKIKVTEKIKREIRRKLSPAEYALHQKKLLACVCLIDAGYPMPKIPNVKDLEKLLALAYLLCKQNAINTLIDYRSQFLSVADNHSFPIGFSTKYHSGDLRRAIDSESIGYLSSQKPVLAETFSMDGVTALSPTEYALRNERYSSFVCLVDAGYPMPSDISAGIIARIVPVACSRGHFKIAERLLKSLSTPSVAIFQDAINQDNIPFLTALLKVWELSSCKIDDLPPVSYALHHKKYAAAVCLMNAGFQLPVGLKEDTGNMLYSLACRMGCRRVIRDLDHYKLTQEKVLRDAIDEESVEYLKEQRVVEVTFDGLSPTEYAAHCQKYNALVCLFDVGYPIPQNFDSESAYQVLDIANKMGKQRVVQKLIAHCKDMQVSPERGACMARNIRALVRRAIDEDDRDLLKAIHMRNLYYPHQSAEDSPVRYAFIKGNYHAVSFLLDMGIYPYSPEVLRPELYWAAAEHQHNNTLKLLLDNHIPLPKGLLNKALQEGYFQSAAVILTHPTVAEKVPHPFHLALSKLNNHYHPNLGMAFFDIGLDPLDRDESGKSFFRLVVEAGDGFRASTLFNLVDNIENTPGHKKELAKVLEEIANDNTVLKKEDGTKLTQNEINTLLLRGFRLFGDSDANRIVELSLHLQDPKLLQILPQMIPGYNAQPTDEIVKAFDAKLEEELHAFEKHAKEFALEPIGQTLAKMVQLELGFKAMEKMLNEQQSEILKEWVEKIGELLKEAGAIEVFPGKMKELGVTADRTEEDFQKIGKWMATLKKDDLSLLKAGLKYFGKAELALVYLCEFVEDRELIEEGLKEFGAKELNEFGRKLAYRLGCTVLEFNQARGKTSQEHLVPLLTEMTKLGNFANQMKGLDPKVQAEIQAQALKARACNPAFQVADDFAELLKSAGITGHDINDRRRIVDLIPLLDNGEVQPRLNGKRGYVIEQLLSFLDGDLYRGILAFYPFLHNTAFLATLPSMNGSLLQGIDSFIAARLAALKKKENTPELLKLLLLWQALKPLRPKPYNIPLAKDLAEKLFGLIEQNLRIGMGALPITPSHLKNMQEQHQLATRLAKLLSKDDQRILAELSERISRIC